MNLITNTAMRVQPLSEDQKKLEPPHRYEDDERIRDRI